MLASIAKPAGGFRCTEPEVRHPSTQIAAEFIHKHREPWFNSNGPQVRGLIDPLSNALARRASAHLARPDADAAIIWPANLTNCGRCALTEDLRSVVERRHRGMMSWESLTRSDHDIAVRQ